MMWRNKKDEYEDDTGALSTIDKLVFLVAFMVLLGLWKFVEILFFLIYFVCTLTFLK